MGVDLEREVPADDPGVPGVPIGFCKHIYE